MSWAKTLVDKPGARVVEAAALGGRAQLDAHLEALAGGPGQGAGAPPRPEHANGDDAEAWRLALTHGELLAALGLGPGGGRAAPIVVCLDGDPPLALRGEGGELLALRCGVEALDGPELLAALGAGELVLLGPADRLHQLAELFARREGAVEVRAVIVDHLPLLPGAARLLHEAFAAPVGEALRDEAGGLFALARGQGELLVQLRRREELFVCDRAGDQLAGGSWGLLGVVRGGEPVIMPVWARVQTNREGEPAVELGVPATPLGSRTRPELTTVDLHDMLGTLPVFAWRARFTPEAESLLELAILPGREPEASEAEILAAIAPGVDQLEVVFVAPGHELEGPRVFDSRMMFTARVVVVWAGEPGSEARRAGWREAVSAAGSGSPVVHLFDARSGEPLAGVAAEVAAELRRDRGKVAKLFDIAMSERSVYVGDARSEGAAALANRAEGWITLLEGDAEHEALFIASTELGWARDLQLLLETGERAESLGRLSLDGVSLESYTRPALGRGRARFDDRRTLWLDEARCVGSGDCARICPTHAITMVATGAEPAARPHIDEAACIACQLCVERCEVEALRPMVNDQAAIEGDVLVREAELLRTIRTRARPRALEGKLVEPPPALDARSPASAPAKITRKPTVVLGLATVTLMEHAAALLVDGELVSAIEEERLARDRHYTWAHPERPGTSLSADICLRLEESWPPRAIAAVLRTAGLSMDEVDLVAVNGIPARYRRSFLGGGGWRPPPVLRANSLVFVPHHMSHAACVYGLSDYDDAWILSIDGRGDYETATVWRARGHELEVVDAVPWLPDCSFGGVYETATRVLGFGSHGQGSTMALAALGEAGLDVSACMSLGPGGRPVLSEWAAEKLFEPYTRAYDDPLSDAHKQLAASIQLALETTVGDYLAHHAGDLRGKKLALCGGVALNCRMNGVLRDRFAPADMYVAPAANDAGTAIGAALIGHRELTGELPRLGLGHTHLGPSWSDEAVARALERMRVPFSRLKKVGPEVAELLDAGQIVCWFQGPMEFGPRALGGRSILADPRREDLKARLNHMKSRQPWRPFGSSILAGHQSEWFEQDWDSRFMLFAVDVRPDRRAQVPVIVHADGSSRPQVVHAEHHGRYHALISAFFERTGVPMVVNTSFNRGGEPIVCNPVEAMRSFVGLGADAIVLGDCLVRRSQLQQRRR